MYTSNLLTFLLFFVIVINLSIINVSSSVTPSVAYYISSSQGNDNNDGLSPFTPFQTLYRITPSLTASLQPGDSILLRQQDIFILNSVWWLTNLTGNATHPITIGSYSSSSSSPSSTSLSSSLSMERPLLLRNTSLPSPGPTLTIDNSYGLIIQGIEISGGEAGLVFTFHSSNDITNPIVYPNILIQDNFIHNIRGLHPNTTNAVWWAHCIALAADYPIGANVTNLTIQNNYFNNSDAVYDNRLLYPGWNHVYISGMNFLNNTLTHISFNTLYIDYSRNVLIQGNVLLKNAPAFLFTLGTTDIIIDGTDMDASNRIVDNEIGWRGEYSNGGPDGCGIDFENSSNGIMVSQNYIHHSFGAGIMVLGHQMTSHNLFFTENIMLYNGCNQTRADRGGIAFLQPNSSGTISLNIFATCPTVPLFNPVQPGYLQDWNITNDNLIDGINGTILHILPYPIVTSRIDPVTGNLVILANISNNTGSSSSGSNRYKHGVSSLAALPMILRYTMDGSKPRTDSLIFPSNGKLILPPRTIAINIKTFLSSSSSSSSVTRDDRATTHGQLDVESVLLPLSSDSNRHSSSVSRFIYNRTTQIIIVESPTNGGIFSPTTTSSSSRIVDTDST